MDGARKYHPESGNPITKEYTWYALTDKWISAQKLGITKIEFKDHMKLKKKEDTGVDTLVHLDLLPWSMEIKMPMGGDTETKCRAETEGKAIHRLPYLGIHLIYCYQTQTLLWMPTRPC